MKNKYKSIIVKILFPITLAIILESFFVIFTLSLQTKPKLNNYLIENFKSSVELRTNYLETSMTNKWSSLDNEYQSIVKNATDYTNTKGNTIDEVINTPSLSHDFLLKQADIISSLLSSNNVTNSFIILDNENHDSIFLSTKNPNKVTTVETIVNFAPTSVVKYYYENGYNIDMDAYTSSFKDFSSTDFYTKPLNYAKENNVSTKVSGYWSSDMILSSINIFTYTIPIKVSNKVIGVLGIGLTSSYLQSSLNSLNKGSNLNIMLIRNTSLGFDEVFKAYTDYSIPSLKDVDVKSTKYSNVNKFCFDDNTEYMYSDKISSRFNTYEEDWYVVGIMNENDIFKISNKASSQVLLIICIGTLSIFVLVYLITLLVSRPILKVSNEISKDNIYNIPRTNISEVDLLLNKLETYFNSIQEFNKKLNKILDKSTVSIAVAEYLNNSSNVNTSSKFYSILNLNYTDESVSKEEFINRLSKLSFNIASPSIKVIDESIFKESSELILEIDKKTIRLTSEVTDSGVIFTLVDLTKEYFERKSIEHERDYDVLTGLLNRRGIRQIIEKNFDKGNKNCAVFMIDIDNLKKFNDDFGHDFGDKYLITVGNEFKKLMDKYPNLYAAHLSGDEYILYLQKPSKNIINNIAKSIDEIRDIQIDCFNANINISLSCGVAEYEEGLSFNELKKRADFTMYQVKNNGKNYIAFFDSVAYELYEKENFMQKELNMLITNSLLTYHYQPIVDIKTGEILGYEALMRPTLESFKSPLTVIEYAKKYKRLYDIELLTFFNAASIFSKSNSNKKLFINSISSQILSAQKFEEFASDYKSILNNIIIEIIEEDFGEDSIIKNKIDTIKYYGMNYAIDDYGTGYNNLGMLLHYSPVYIKLEGSLIRGIDHDDKKRQFTKSIIDFCKANNILIVAESVETIEELKCVKTLGADYVQGFLISRPNPNVLDIPDDIKEMIKNI